MANPGLFALYLIIAIIAVMLAVSLKGWIAKLIFFLIALGAATLTVGALDWSVGWRMLINVVLFVLVGLSAVRVKTTGNRIFGIVLIVVGALLIIPTVNSLGYSAPGTIGGGVVSSFQQGWESFMDTLQQVFGGS